MVCFIKKYIVLELLKRCNSCQSFLINHTVSKIRRTSSVMVYCTSLQEPVVQEPEVQESSVPENVGNKKISKAVLAYKKRAEEYDIFMKQQMEEYEAGKKYLAKMMGKNPETFTQEDIDESIEYLFPSGLYEPLARPMLKHPSVLFPKCKEAQYDETGRPHHFLYYTVKQNYSQLLHDCATYIDRLTNKMRGKSVTSSLTRPMTVIGTNWITKQDLEKKLLEKILDIEYNKFIEAMDRLVECPYSYEYADFIMQYRVSCIRNVEGEAIPEPIIREDGRRSVTITNCSRKTSIGEVTVIYPGTGKITINNQGIDYFKEIPPREQVIFPLIFTKMLEKVDVEATVTSGSFSGQSGAIRWGVAMGLRSFVPRDTVTEMKLAGLLKRDPRRRERKKPGQRGARRKYNWRKR